MHERMQILLQLQRRTLLKLDRYRTTFIIDQLNCNSTNNNVSGKNILYKYNYINI